MIFIILHCSGMTLRCTKLLSTSSSKQISFVFQGFYFFFLILAANIFNQQFSLKIFLTSKRGLSLIDFYLPLLPVFRQCAEFQPHWTSFRFYFSLMKQLLYSYLPLSS